MSQITVKDLAGAGDVRALSSEEMENIHGGTDVSGPFGAWGVIDAILAPLSFDEMEKWAKEKASKQKQ